MLHVAGCSPFLFLSASFHVHLCVCTCTCRGVHLHRPVSGFVNVSAYNCECECQRLPQRKRETPPPNPPKRPTKPHPPKTTMRSILAPTTVQHKKSSHAKESHIREFYCCIPENYLGHCSFNSALSNVYNRQTASALLTHKQGRPGLCREILPLKSLQSKRLL